MNSIIVILLYCNVCVYSNALCVVCMYANAHDIHTYVVHTVRISGIMVVGASRSF